MLIGLHDSDNTGFPNMALMKISAYHKALGDVVEWWNPMISYDRVYSSKVFTFTPENPYLPDGTFKGGTGYGKYNDLPPDIDSIFPDYSIYPKVKYAIGFLTRGCIRNCPWCIVPRKEGRIRPYDTWEHIKRPDSRDIVFMDNNVLACPHGIEQMENMVGKDVRVDFNQGLDARLVSPEIAKILSGLKWIRFIRTACDTDDSMETVARMVENLAICGVKPYRVFCYVLVRDIQSAEKRVQFLRKLGCDPFAQPYRDFTTNAEPSREAKDFARWVNNKAIFRSCESFAQYKYNKRGHNKEMEQEGGK